MTSDILCQCGCGQKIILKFHHKYYGIPKYVPGHNWSGKKRGPQSVEHLAKIAKVCRRHTGKHHSIESKQKIREANTGKGVGKIHSIEVRAKIGEGSKKAWDGYSKEQRGKRVSKLVEVWNNYTKEQRNERVAKMFLAVSKSPNNFEVRALNYLNTIYKDKFEYTGNGKMVVNSRSADAYSEELKTVALFHGIYYHWWKYHPGVEITEMDRRSVEKVDSIPFTTDGYKVIFIWEDELDSMISSVSELEIQQ